jgi:YhcH/YjgK/YiaL family protein
LEAHRKYIDIQYVTLGHELIGWERIEECAGKGLGYDADNDIEFYGNPPSLWFPVPAGVFAVFFPEDAHAPLAGETPVRKIVVKAPVAGYPS